MSKNLFHPWHAARFRRFSGKAYAAFQSMHRQVTIGRVCASIANLEMLKAGRSVAVCVGVLVGGIMYADENAIGEEPILTVSDSVLLPQVEVVAQQAEHRASATRLVYRMSATDIAQMPVRTVSDLLNYVPGVDVRTRGANGAQADVSMRGSTFDQVLVFINGVNLTDAHTGHYALNLPIDVSLIDHIDVIQSTDVTLGGMGGFAGAINIITKESKGANGSTMDGGSNDVQAVLRLTGGMNSQINPALSVYGQLNGWKLSASMEYSEAKGYAAPSPSEKEQKALDNSDLRLCNVYLRAGYKGLDLQAGAQYKDAGAGMFYGFGSQDQFDATRTAFVSGKYHHSWGAWELDATAAYRANYDRYEWHRGQRLYGNFHFSQNTSALLAGSYLFAHGKSTIGVEMRNENIHSTNLGDTVNVNGQVPNRDGFDLDSLKVLDLVRYGNRLSLNYFYKQLFFYGDWVMSAGVNGHWNSFFGHNVTADARVSYQYSLGQVYVNGSRSLRLPTYTDLYYNAGNQLGSRDLKPETAWTLSIGQQLRKDWQDAGEIRFSADAYYRWGRNIIDWVYVAEDSKRPYHATNQNEVNALGLETSIEYRLNDWLRNVSVSYAYTYLDLDLEKSGSRYLDYLSHKLVFSLSHAIYTCPTWTLGADWHVTFQKREGQFNNAEGEVCDYQPVVLLDGSIYYQYKMLRASVDCTNMTNRRYYDYGGILQPGIWPRMTVQITL